MNALHRVDGKRLTVLSVPSIGLVVSIAVLIFSVIFTTKPGPVTYTSHFAGVFFSACLAFGAIQLIFLLRHRWHYGQENRKKAMRLCCTWSLYTYWAVVTISGLVCLVTYAVIPLKDERIAIQLFIFLLGATGIVALTQRWPETFSGAAHPATKIASVEPDAQNTSRAEHVETSTSRTVTASEYPRSTRVTMRHTALKWCAAFGRGFNRFLRVVHALFSILFMAGGISLTLTYRYDNPGQIATVSLASGTSIDVSYYCTSLPSPNGTALPTFWFESSPAHGVVDFLGLQTILADTHGRNSCSYDPANFGWSSRLSASESDFFIGFEPLAKGIGRQDEDKVFVGWAGGIPSALDHIAQAPQVVKGLVLLDPGPDGIEWLDLKRKNNWTVDEMLAFRQTDLMGRTILAQMILTLGIPWGLIPTFIPSNPANYFNAELYPRYRAQSMKEDMWAAQYFSLRVQAATPMDLNGTGPTVARGVPTYAVLTRNSGTDEASNDFYREEKLAEANRLAGGKLAAPVTWCDEEGCELSFPVAKAAWTAGVLAGLGV